MTALLVLLLATPALAAVELEARLAPPPGVTVPAAGVATLELADDGRVRWDLQVRDMSGFGTVTAIRRRDDGRPVATLTNPPPTGTHVGTFGPLDDPTRDALLGGMLELVMATAAHPDGELRGAIGVSEVPGLTCTCAGETKAAFRACVRRRLAAAPSLRRSPMGRRLRAAVRRATCGALTGARRGRSVCCLPWVPDGNIVVERLCAMRPRAVCRRMGGVPGGDGGCRPTTCGASSAGARLPMLTP
jgi:hypothetical protein